MSCPACGLARDIGGCPLCSRQAATVGLVVPDANARPQEVPIVTPAQMDALVARQAAKDKAYADAKAVAARLRRQIQVATVMSSPAGLDPDEVEILISYFLDGQ